ncbi:hypothetical protein CW705_05015 [Candidatus Bathyarchaeota archaeon]|nr:MAG: hypothetical protein CW705_05015 [Candidatus Bathyarchaeota archaeon]
MRLKCQYCQKNVSLPFKCPFCGKYFCADHRLPENHACTELWKVKIRPVPPIERDRTVDFGDVETQRPPPIEHQFPIKRERWTSKTEIYHLAVGAVIVMAVGLSMSGYGFSWLFRIIRNPSLMFGSSFIFMIVFLSHELAHKASAKHFGLWAEFRLSLLGAALTVLSILSPLIKIISPGAVMISGVADRKTVGKIAFAGPLTNIILAAFLYLVALQIHVPLLSVIFSWGAALSIWMATFNLIPIGIFDGAKVLWWNKIVWLTSFLISAALSIVFILL